jgi:hypothetical protein
MSAPAAGDEASPADRQTARRLRSGDDDETAAASGVRGSMNVSLADSLDDCDGQCSGWLLAGWLAAPLTGAGFRPKRESQTGSPIRAVEQQRIALVTAISCGVCVCCWCVVARAFGCGIGQEIESQSEFEFPLNWIEPAAGRGRRRAGGASGGLTSRLVGCPCRSSESDPLVRSEEVTDSRRLTGTLGSPSHRTRSLKTIEKKTKKKTKTKKSSLSAAALTGNRTAQHSTAQHRIALRCTALQSPSATTKASPFGRCQSRCRPAR